MGWLAAVGAQGRLYDAVGNTLQDGALQSRYDARNRLTETIRGGAVTRYGYSAFGERVCNAPGAQPCAENAARREYLYDDAGHLVGGYRVADSRGLANAGTPRRSLEGAEWMR